MFYTSRWKGTLEAATVTLTHSFTHTHTQPTHTHTPHTTQKSSTFAETHFIFPLPWKLAALSPDRTRRTDLKRAWWYFREASERQTLWSKKPSHYQCIAQVPGILTLQGKMKKDREKNTKNYISQSASFTHSDSVKIWIPFKIITNSVLHWN